MKLELLLLLGVLGRGFGLLPSSLLGWLELLLWCGAEEGLAAAAVAAA
jgi:hypothetical protein